MPPKFRSHCVSYHPGISRNGMTAIFSIAPQIFYIIYGLFAREISNFSYIIKSSLGVFMRFMQPDSVI